MARARLRAISRSLRWANLEVARASEVWAVAEASCPPCPNNDLSRRMVSMAPDVTVLVAAITASWGRKVLPLALVWLDAGLLVVTVLASPPS